MLWHAMIKGVNFGLHLIFTKEIEPSKSLNQIFTLTHCRKLVLFLKKELIIMFINQSFTCIYLGKTETELLLND